jgi:hypothetical protein
MRYVLPLLFVFVAGCSSLQYALETAERTRDAMEAAGAELRDAMEVAGKARETYIEALKSGDHDRLEAALAAMQAAEIERTNRELKFEATQKAFDQASRELERAKAEDNYFEGVLGLLFGALVGGGGGFLTGRKRNGK